MSEATLARMLRVEVRAAGSAIDVEQEGTAGTLSVQGCDPSSIVIHVSRPDGTSQERTVDLTDVNGAPRSQTLAIAIVDLWLDRGSAAPVDAAREASSAVPSSSPPACNEPVAAPLIRHAASVLSFSAGAIGAWTASPNQWFGGAYLAIDWALARPSFLVVSVRTVGLYAQGHDPIGAIDLVVARLCADIEALARLGLHARIGAAIEICGGTALGFGRAAPGAQGVTIANPVADVGLSATAGWQTASGWLAHLEIGPRYVIAGVIEGADDRPVVGWSGLVLLASVALGFDVSK